MQIINFIKSLFNKPVDTKTFKSINETEVVNLESGEIIPKEQYDASYARAVAMELGEQIADVPLYKQTAVAPEESLRVVITGKFDCVRREIVERLNEMNITVGSVVNGKTDVLVIGEWGLEVGADGVSNKYLEAVKRGVKVLRFNNLEEILSHFSMEQQA